MTQTLALTFDDGPSPWTEPLLDILASHGARATFFVIGRHAEKHPGVLKRIADEGHEIGNHTWSHPWLARDCDDQRVREELDLTNRLIADVVGASTRRFRAPHYDVDDRVETIAAQLSLVHTRGDVTPPDWHPAAQTAYLATYALQRLRPGMVLGLHDGVPPGKSATRGREVTLETVALVIPRLCERGLQCVTASDVLETDSQSS
jgi:peptidoglycan-N-acetylglucosamine deacetylase